MKNFYRIFILTFLLLSTKAVFPQDFQGYIVKKIGNLVVIDVGTKKGLIQNSSYIIKKIESLKIPLVGLKVTSKEFSLGQFVITQLEGDYCVGKILKSTGKKFEAGDKVSIYYYAYSDFISDQKEEMPPVAKDKPEEEVKIKAEDIKEQIYKPEEKKPVKQEIKMPWEKRNPISLGGGFGFGIKSIPEGILGNIEEFLINEIYIDNPVISTSLKQSSGFGFSVGYFPLSFLSVDLEYQGFSNTSSISSLSSFAEEVEQSGPLPDDPIKSWDFDVKTSINIFSVSASLGNYAGIIENYKNNLKSRKPVYYFGGGVNYCNLGVNFDENYVIYGLNNREDLVYRSEDFSPGKYTGWFIKAGGGLTSFGGMLFGEIRYFQWENLKLDKSTQFYLGFKTFF